jgi:hypothetical protein
MTLSKEGNEIRQRSSVTAQSSSPQVHRALRECVLRSTERALEAGMTEVQCSETIGTLKRSPRRWEGRLVG